MEVPRILVAQNDMFEGLQLEQQLGRWGYEVPAVVTRSADALTQAATLNPDLVLMDVCLEGNLAGAETARGIQARQSIPVLFLAANAEDAAALQTNRISPMACLVKPFHERELKTTIALMLKNQALHRQLQEVTEQLDHRVRERTDALLNANRTLREEIRQREAAEQAASEWKRRYDLIVASSGQAVFDYDLVAGTIVWSPGVEDILGHKADDLHRARTEWSNLIHADDRTRVLDQAARAVSLESSYEIEYRFHHGCGHDIWIYERGFIVRNSSRRATRMFGMMLDITARKLAAEKIREQAALLEKVQDAIIVYDLRHSVQYWNLSAERQYGYARNEALGQPVQKLLLKGTEAHLPEADAATLQFGEWSGEVKTWTKAGAELIVHSRWTLLRNSQGSPQAFLVAHTDLTQQKMLEAKFLRAQRLESVGALASGIAHDLNNSFAPILMAAHMLEGKCTDPAVGQLLEPLIASARRGAEMVKQILIFTRGLKAEGAHVQLRHLVNEIQHIAKETFPPRIQIHRRLSRDLWPVPGNPTQMHQVLMNLCINARDAMPTGGVLTLSAENVTLDEQAAKAHRLSKPGPYVVLRIADTGTGIKPEVIDRIFEPFFTTKEPGSGTGLGLSTVLGIVQAHQGSVEVTSKPGAGSQFTIYLPADPTASPTTKDAQAAPPPRGKGELLLVADDESTVRELMKTILETHGYQVILAIDGSEAVALYASHRDQIALVISDMVMPIMDGFATFRALRKIEPKVKLLAISGSLGQEKGCTLESGHTVPFLAKPCSPDALLNTIRSVLDAVPA